MKQAAARIVALATIRAGDEAADVHASAVEIFRNSKCRATTARDQEHAIPGWLDRIHHHRLYGESACELQYAHDGGTGERETRKKDPEQGGDRPKGLARHSDQPYSESRGHRGEHDFEADGFNRGASHHR